jgi:hypothetical protein
MTDVSINSVSASINFQPDSPSGTPAASGMAGGQGDDPARLRALLRPIILELLEDELGNYLRMRG